MDIMMHHISCDFLKQIPQVRLFLNYDENEDIEKEAFNKFEIFETERCVCCASWKLLKTDRYQRFMSLM